jgi:hypothetical protein
MKINKLNLFSGLVMYAVGIETKEFTGLFVLLIGVMFILISIENPT